jgi:hypothetical protein
MKAPEEGDGTVPFESVVLLTPRFGSRLTAGQDHRTPGRYVGAEEVEEDGEPFDAKMKLTAQLEAQLAEGAKLDAEIRKNLRGLGYGR